MKKIFTILAAAFMSLSLNAASWTFTSIEQEDFYPAGEAAVDGNYWSAEGTNSYKYKNQSSAAELYVADGQKFAPTEGLQFLTRGNTFRVFFNGAGIRLVSQASGVNPSIVIPNCKAGSDLAITVKRDGSSDATTAVSNAASASLALDGTTQNYSSTVLADGDVVINMSAGTGYVRSITLTEHSVYAAQATKAVVKLFEDNVTGVETNCTVRRDAKNYTIDGTSYTSVQAWQLGTSNNLTFRVKNAKKVTFVGRATKDRGFAISLNGADAENVTNAEDGEKYVQKELTMAAGVNVISMSGVGGAVYPLGFIVEKDAEAMATMSGASISFTNGDEIIYSSNIALSTVTNLEGADKKGFATANNIVLYTSSSAEGKTKALRVQGTSTITLAAPSNYIIEKIGVRAATAASSGTRTIKINGANAESYGIVEENVESHYHEWELSSPSNQLTVGTNGTMYLIITLFGYTTNTYPVTVSHGWASFCAPEDVEIPAGLTAYIGESVSAGELALTEIEGNLIPANTGVVLAGEDGAYEMVSTSGAAAIASSFTGTVKRIANPSAESTYTLWYDSDADEVVLAKYTGSYIPANKAYLSYSAPASAPKLRMVVSHQMPTDLESNQCSVFSSQKVIENGQLVIIKNGVRYNAVGQIIK